MPVIEQKTTNKNKVDFDLNRLDKSKTTIFSKYPFFVGLIPKVQPLGDCHGLPGWLRLRSFLCGNQTFEFFLTFGLCFCQHIFSFGQSAVIVADDNAALPAAIASQTDGAAAVFSLLCQGFISSPR